MVTSIVIEAIRLRDQSAIDDFLVLMQAQEMEMEVLEFWEEETYNGLREVVSGLKEKGRTNMKLDLFGIGHEEYVTPGMKDTIKDIWDAVDDGIVVYNISEDSQTVHKSSHDWEGAWTCLQEISNGNTSDDDTSDEESDNKEAAEAV